MWQRLDSKTVLIALVIINVIAIGLSEIQRRSLVMYAIDAQASFQSRASRAAEQQAVELDRMVKQLSVLTDRVNHTEILTLSTPDANNKIQDIRERVIEIQKKLDGLEPSRN
jgi:Tfp pilus assembly protein PilV